MTAPPTLESGETIRCGSVDVPHNTVHWRVCTNRHRSSTGNSWGWIEGAPGNVCWSNDSMAFDYKAALAVVTEHSAWLERQKPIALRIVDATERRDRLAKLYETAQQRADEARGEMNDAAAALCALVCEAREAA